MLTLYFPGCFSTQESTFINVYMLFFFTEYTPSGPNAFLMKIFDGIENTLMLWFPFSIMSFIAVVLVLRCVMLIPGVWRTKVPTPPMPATAEENSAL